MVKRIPAQFTLSDLLAHLRMDEQVPEGFYTATEWAERYGVSYDVMLRILREALAQGVLLRNQAKRERLDGVRMMTPVYAFQLEEAEDGAEPGD